MQSVILPSRAHATIPPTRSGFNDMPPLVLLADITACMAFLTRAPVTTDGLDGDRGLARSAWAFPVVGALVGGLGAVVYAISAGLALTPLIAATLAVASMVAVTGALHEDGLADTADGFGGGRDREAKLGIMRDSHLGVYAALALILMLVLRIAALAALGDPAMVGAVLVTAAAASRAMMAVVMAGLPPARADGLGAGAGAPRGGAVAGGMLVSAVIAVVLLPTASAVGVLIAVSAGGAAMAWLARRQIGGQTGDVLGAVQQIAEAAALVVAVALS